MRLKKEQILSEADIYNSLIETKKQLDKAYFDLFRSQIQEQQISIQSTITQMQALNSMI
jgi:hypothetical protein